MNAWRWLAWMFLLCLMQSAFAQDGKFLRLELETRSNLRPFHLLPMSDQGLMVCYMTLAREDNGNVVWVFQIFDTEFKETWKVEYPLPERMALVESLFSKDKIRILFTGRSAGSSQDQAIILEISPSGDYFMPINISLPDRWSLSHFSYQGQRYVLGGSNRRFESQVLLVSGEGETLLLEPDLKGETWLDDAVFHDSSSSFLLLFRNRASKKQSGLIAVSYDHDGIKRWLVHLEDERNHVATAGRWMISEGLVHIVGVYSGETRTASFSAQSPSTVKASGFFSTTLLDGRQQSMRYYAFSEFTNFFSHLTYHEMSRMRATRKGQSSPVEFSVMLNSIRGLNPENLLMAEAYFPKYQYVTRMSYDYYGRPVPTTYTVFDGYQYTNAFIAAFDSSGQKSWDNNFPIKNIVSNDLRSRVELFHDKDEVIMAYLDEGRIASQVIRGKEVTGPFDYADVEGADPGKRVLEHHEETILPWYDNYLICSGYQKMRSLDTAIGDRRFVFYLTKVAYRQ